MRNVAENFLKDGIKWEEDLFREFESYQRVVSSLFPVEHEMRHKNGASDAWVLVLEIKWKAPWASHFSSSNS